jgi:hypothetical protein
MMAEPNHLIANAANRGDEPTTSADECGQICDAIECK